MALTKSGFLYFALMFYGICFILLGAIPITSDVESDTISSNESLGFSGTFINNIEGLPILFNLIFFGVLGTIVSFAIITTVLGAIFNGGG